MPLRSLTVAQALYAASNFLAAAFAARAQEAELFGVTSLVLLLATIAGLTARAGLNEPDLSSASSARVGSRVLFAVVPAVIAIAVVPSIVVTGLGAGIVVIAQDRLRYESILDRAPARLLALDGTWLAVVVAAGVLRPESFDEPRSAVTVWAAGAAVACLASVGSSVGGALDLLSSVRGKFLAEFGLAAGATHLVSVLLGVILSKAEFASIRSAILVFGPVAVVTTALSTWVLSSQHDRLPIKRLGAVFVVGLGVTAAAVAIPSSVGSLALGDNWPSRTLLTLFGVTVAAQAAAVPMMSFLKSTGAFRAAITVRAVAAASILCLAIAAAQFGTVTQVAGAYVVVNVAVLIVIARVAGGASRGGQESGIADVAVVTGRR